MLSEPELLEHKVEFRAKLRGIYFLIADNQIVYVGQSADILSRILIHAGQIRKTFDSYAFVESTDNLNDLEAQYIVALNPIYNSSMPTNVFYKSLKYLKRHFGAEIYPLKRYIRTHGLTPCLGTYDIRDFADFESECL